MPEPVASAVVIGLTFGVAAVWLVLAGTKHQADAKASRRALMRMALVWCALALVGAAIWAVAQTQLAQ